MRKKNLIIVSMLIVVAIMSIGYAYFATTLNITTTGNISSSWNVKFTAMSAGDANGTKATSLSSSYTDTTATMSVDLKEPGDEMIYELTLTNLGDITAVIEDINAEATGTAAIVFSIEGIKEKDTLAKNETRTIKVKIEFDKYTTSVPSEKTKTLTLSIRAVQLVDQDTNNPIIPEVNQPLLLSNQILKNNTAKSGEAINFASSPRNTNGLYYVSTGTENNGTTYFFRGNVQNNYVEFGDKVCFFGEDTGTCYTTLEACEAAQERYCTDFGGKIKWRIVRINEDGSIRLITVDSIGSTNYGESGDNAYVGYQYGMIGDSSGYGDAHLNMFDSTVKAFIDNWYVNNTNLSQYVDSHLADAGFCNDRSIAPSAGLWASDDTALGYGGFNNNTYYGAYNRLENTRQVQFSCPSIWDSLELKENNGSLDNPIGLITADEMVYASVVDDTYSAILGNNAYTWTMSPARTGFVYYGSFWPFINETERSGSVHPVINLKSNVTVKLTGTGEPGTITNPYIVITN